MNNADALTGPPGLETVFERIRDLLGEIVGDPDVTAGITEETSVVDDLGLDSIQMINFLLRLEDEFDLELDFEGLTFEQVGSVRGLCRFVAAEARRQS
ncbi:phosphopantetheine-binding protein [Streptomyces sp. B1866]|uniref:phosphopantetheine-binding protein n=1 Tax=Streptomyces sp. B1866 TaxID=3075431 RepID=UPI00288D1F7A|nr:phosphopantetheine-binding protein [Streptomyces sp. B1866]MDT3400530.1 phosphopantetheine-binding protein [Streptomyces sp. B1866]